MSGIVNIKTKAYYLLAQPPLTNCSFQNSFSLDLCLFEPSQLQEVVVTKLYIVEQNTFFVGEVESPLYSIIIVGLYWKL